jgi:hypothetical protein
VERLCQRYRDVKEFDAVDFHGLGGNFTPGEFSADDVPPRMPAAAH